MSGHSLHKSAAILLVGAGPTSANMVTKGFAHVRTVVAVDGGLAAVRACGLQADAVIGDFDSVGDSAETPRISTPDQNLTDFQKALTVVDAPVILGVGFLGGRLDHQLASFTALLMDPRPIILIDDQILCCVVPDRFTAQIPDGSPVAFYPMLPCMVDLEGVKYPLTGAPMAPDGLISTSNHMASSQLTIRTDRRGLIAILPVGALAQVISALSPTP